jgi:drug/metabolite transporter (DMT)-like permease
MQRSNTLLVLITLSFLWGSSFLAIKVVIQVIPPILAFGIRFAIAGAALLVAYVVNERRQHMKNEHIGKHQWKDALLVAILIVVGGQGLLVWGTQYLSSGMTALLNSTIPLWIAIFAAVAFKQHLTKRMILGLIAGFLGLLILLNPFSGGTANNAINVIGVISLTLSSILWALGSLYSSKAHLPVSILASAGMLMLLGGLILVATSFAIRESKSVQFSSISINSLIAYLYLIFLCTAVGYAEFFWLLHVESESVANSFAYIVPVIAVFLGWALFKEAISLQVLIATCVIMIGVALMVTSSSKSGKNNSSVIEKCRKY